MTQSSSQWAVITAGTKGIGRAIVERFAREGFAILTCARNEEGLKALARELVARHPGARIEPLAVDLSTRAGAASFVEYCDRTAPDCDVLVNNAGVFVPGQIHSEDEGALEKMIQTNLYSAYHVTRGILPRMLAKKRGHVFNICSTASITSYVNGGSYCISKFALHGMTKVLREEMKPHGIRVTSVLPGATRTASWDGTELPDERFMKASDVADAIWAAYQLSPQAVIEELLLRPQLGDLG